MSTLRPEQLAQAFTQSTADLTEPFVPVRTVTAGVTEILRRTDNPWGSGRFDVARISPEIPNPDFDPTKPADDDSNPQTIENPTFEIGALLGLSRPTAAAIVLLTCPHDALLGYLDEGRLDRDAGTWTHPSFDRAVNEMLASYSDRDIIAQAAAVREALENVTRSRVKPLEADPEAAMGKPEQAATTAPNRIGSPPTSASC